MPQQSQSVIEITRIEREQTREREYYLYEEATDIAERLGYPIDHLLTHRIFDGRVYDSKFVRIAEYTQRSFEEAPKLFTGDAAFEVCRREVEHQKTLRVEDLAAGKLGGNAMIEYSPAPRDVLEGKTHIDGYRADLRRDFVRIYYAEDEQMHCRIVSLDNVTEMTRMRVGQWLGIAMAGRSDIDIMSDDVITDLTADQVDEIVMMTKLIHDDELEQSTGKRFHAGSRYENREGALQMVLSQSDLMDEHMNVWSEIVGRAIDRKVANRQMDPQRKRSAAAVFGRMQGMAILSTNDGGVSDVMATNNFDAGCAIGGGESNTISDMGMSQGKKEFISETCPMCGDKKVLTKIEGSVISGSCGCARDICTGYEISVNRRKGLLDNRPRDHEVLRAQTMEKSLSKPEMTNREVKKLYGKFAELRTMIAMGGTTLVAYDIAEKRVITTL